MNCADCEILISRFIDNELSEKDQKRLMRHLNECSSCRKKLESLRVLSKQLKGLPKIEGDLDERNRIIASVHSKIEIEPIKKTTFRPLPIQKLAWAGGIIVAAILVIAIIGLPHKQIQNPGTVDNPEISTIPPQMEETLINDMVEYLGYERIHASNYETFGEPVMAVFASQPAPPLEGKPETPSVEPDISPG